MMRIMILVVLLVATPWIAGATEKYPVQMSWQEADAYLRSKGYPTRPGRDVTALRGEDGKGPSYVFEFPEANSGSPASCIGVFDVKKIDWRTIVSELTGVPVSKIPKGKQPVVTVDGRRLPIKIEKGSVGVYVGTCEL